jgi:hypothetical protein
MPNGRESRWRIPWSANGNRRSRARAKRLGLDVPNGTGSVVTLRRRRSSSSGLTEALELADPDLLGFDEATSALDPALELPLGRPSNA